MFDQLFEIGQSAGAETPFVFSAIGLSDDRARGNVVAAENEGLGFVPRMKGERGGGCGDGLQQE